MHLDKPIIILGAARSGTKLLRGILASHPGLSAVPWDVNFIWKYGNYGIPHDELEPGNLEPRIRRFIETSLARFLRSGTHRLVEKTVGNTLRPAFVRAALPGCVFVHLVRDGRDVAESARRMWQAPLDWRAVLEKVRSFPPAAVPTYGVQYVRGYVRRALGQRDGAVASWGPRWRGIDKDVRELPLIDVCALQWVHSLARTRACLDALPTSDWIEVRYERLVADPAAEVARLLAFLGLDPCPEVGDHIARTLTDANVGKGKHRLTAEELRQVEKHAGAMLQTLGYMG